MSTTIPTSAAGTTATPDRQDGSPGDRPVIEVRNLHKRYRDQVAVRDVSFTVERGEIFGIIGPNGAGKTTTVEIIEGLRVPDAGTVSVLGWTPSATGTS